MAAPDYTNKYNTPLTQEQESQFQSWAKEQGNISDLYDYDMRGYWLKNNGKDDKNSLGHYTDAFKKPNHPTFSDESIYNGLDGNYGGKWIQNGDKWTFQAAPTNIIFNTPSELKNYFKNIEPDSMLVMPSYIPWSGILRQTGTDILPE